MKKIISNLIILVVICITLSSCVSFPFYHTIHNDSLEEYREKVEYSEGKGLLSKLDYVGLFLPSATFISDYEYISGTYDSFSETVMNWIFPDKKAERPTRSILTLTYDEKNYQEAKLFMLESIPMYGEKIYSYNDYVFYLNSNFFNEEKNAEFPNYFTMACYNDSNNTLVFLGFHDIYMEEYEIQSIKDDWQGFLDIHYSEYYDFSKTGD